MKGLRSLFWSSLDVLNILLVAQKTQFSKNTFTGRGGEQGHSTQSLMRRNEHFYLQIRVLI